MGVVRAELLKFFTTRLWWGMAIGVFASASLLSLLYGILYTSKDFLDNGGGGLGGGAVRADPVQVANTVYSAGIGVGYLLMLVIGVIQIGAEYRHKTITSTFLATPRRGRVLVAKVVALVLIAAAYGALALVGSVAVGALTLNLRGADPFPSGTVARTLALSLLVLGLWALIGLGTGILIPNQVAALLIGVAVAWLVEPLLGVLLGAWDFGAAHVAPYLPSQATQAVLDVAQSSGGSRLSWWGGALTLLAWAALFALLGSVRALRQDIT